MCKELTPIELENNFGPDVNGVVHRVPWKAYDVDEVDALLAEKDKALEYTKALTLRDIEIIKNKDKEIESLKAKVDDLSFDKKLLESHWEAEKIRCEAASRDCIELTNENAKLVSKIDSLKAGHRQGIANLKSYFKTKLESLKASHYSEMVDAGMRERRLRRALWLERVDRAISMSCIDMYSKYKEKHPFTINQSFDEWVLIWQVVERKCRAMAERYMEGKA